MSTQQFTLADISSALSQLFTLPPDHEGVAKFSGMLHKTVNDDPKFRQNGLHGSGFASLAMSNLPAELAAAADRAARRIEALVPLIMRVIAAPRTVSAEQIARALANGKAATHA